MIRLTVSLLTKIKDELDEKIKNLSILFEVKMEAKVEVKKGSYNLINHHPWHIRHRLSLHNSHNEIHTGPIHNRRRNLWFHLI